MVLSRKHSFQHLLHPMIHLCIPLFSAAANPSLQNRCAHLNWLSPMASATWSADVTWSTWNGVLTSALAALPVYSCLISDSMENESCTNSVYRKLQHFTQGGVRCKWAQTTWIRVGEWGSVNLNLSEVWTAPVPPPSLIPYILLTRKLPPSIETRYVCLRWISDFRCAGILTTISMEDSISTEACLVPR